MSSLKLVIDAVSDQELNEAINVLGRYAQSRLPEDYSISLYFTKDEVSLTLEDPDYCELTVYTDECAFRDAVDTAIADVIEHKQSEGDHE